MRQLSAHCLVLQLCSFQINVPANHEPKLVIANGNRTGGQAGTKNVKLGSVKDEYSMEKVVAR
jgi:hypothetical protein